MFKQLNLLRGLSAIALVGCLALTAPSAEASRKPHDATRKVVRTSASTAEPRGTFGEGIAVPRTLSSSSAISSVEAQGEITNFNVEGGTLTKKALNAPMRIAPTMPLRACVTYDIDNKSYGMVNVTADGLEVLREHEGLQAGWGGTGVGSKYYFNTCAEVVGGAVTDVETYLWDTSDWRCIGYDQDPDLNVLSYSMTCDPLTEVVYGCFFSEDLQSVEIGTLDPMTMKRTGVLGSTETPLAAMGFSSDGTLYGIDFAGVLYTVSTTDGHYTKVAETGLATRYNTTGTIDYFNDVFYYATCPAGPNDDPSKDWALYSIDLRNGYKVEKCWALRAELGGMYVANPAAKATAPAAPTLTDVEFVDGSLSGTVSFTSPDVTFDGSDLTGDLTYGILANDVVIAKGTTARGKSEKISILLRQEGMYTIRVFVSNSDGDSPKSDAVTRWIGNGKPLEPTNVKASYAYGDSQIALTWDAVTGAFNNGYFDAEKATYTVTRSINGAEPVVVAENISETQFIDPVGDVKECTIYDYTVTCSNSGLSSEPVGTGYVAVGAIVPPFKPDFSNGLVAGYFTSKDYLNGNLSWKYSSYDEAMMMLMNAGWGSGNMDVALMTVPVELKAGQVYEVSYNAWVESYNNNGIGIQWGTSPDNMETVVDPVDINANNSTYTSPLHQSVMVKPTSDGVYYFSVRLLAKQASSVKVFVKDFTISEGLSNKAPDAVTDVTFTPPYDGSKKLDISFTAPSVNLEGKKLTDVTKIEVTRNGKLVYTFRNPTFGQKLSFTDTGSKNEDVQYVITPFNTHGQGKSYYANSHIGVNMPVSPEDCKIEQDMSRPGMVTVSWTPVAKDINGNEFDPSLLRYAIFASDYETILASNITAADASVTFRAIDANAGQAFVWYCVVPYTEGGANGYNGGFGKTPMIPVGTPFEFPYFESFSDNALHYPMGQSGSASMRITAAISSQGLTIGSQDGDNGLIALYPAPGDFVDLYSANINVDDADDVAMSFYYTGVPDLEGYYVEPYVICDGKKELLCTPIDTREAAEKGWNRVQVSLTKWKGKTIQFAFYIRCEDNNFGFGLDNITLKRYAACDLRAGSVSGPKKLTIGQNHDIIVEVVNEGSDDAPAGYEVDLYADGNLAKTIEGPALKAFTTEALKFDYMPDPFAKDEQKFHAVIRWDVDEIEANNTSDEITVPVEESTYPAVTDLTATLGDDEKSADLAWTEPDHQPKLMEITESFENYDPFTIAGFGDWSVYDGDEMETWSIGGNIYVPGVGNVPSYDNAKTPKAWMVIDQSKMKLYYEGARTGNCAAMATSVSGEADDWMISPELPGIAQKVTFYAATAPEEYGEESFEFYYSTGSTDPADFIMLGDRVDVPEGEYVEDEYGDEEMVTTWYEYSYDLPEGAKYFAIRYVSDDIMALFVDDITFTVYDEVLTLQGYNLFRNGKQVNKELLTATSLKDDLSEQDPGNYDYAVETVYDKGHSGVSNVASVTVPEPVGIDGIAAGGLNVSAEKGIIIVKGAAGQQLGIYNASGIKIFDAIVGDTLRLGVESGLYLVKTGDAIVKVMVP